MVSCCNLRHVEGAIVFGILLWKCDLPVLLSVADFSLGILLPLLGLAGSQKCKLLGLLLQICCEKLATALHTSTDSASSSPRTGPQKISHWFPAGSSFVYVTKLMVLLHPVLPDSCRFFFFWYCWCHDNYLFLLPQIPLSQAIWIWRLGWWQETVSLHLLFSG